MGSEPLSSTCSNPLPSEGQKSSQTSLDQDLLRSLGLGHGSLHQTIHAFASHGTGGSFCHSSIRRTSAGIGKDSRPTRSYLGRSSKSMWQLPNGGWDAKIQSFAETVECVGGHEPHQKSGNTKKKTRLARTSVCLPVP